MEDIDIMQLMKRNDSIFYKLTRENENSTTELLCNLLRSKYIRDLCLKFFVIPEDIIKTIGINNIHTQYYDKELGIPDIVIKGKNYCYIIENKIKVETDLTLNQKGNYIKLLKKSGTENIGLRFLVPEKYPPEKINELKEIYHEDDLLVKTWKEFLDHLYEHEIQKESILVNEVLNYFCALLGYSSCEDTKLTPYEVAMLYNPRDIFESLKLMDKVCNTIKVIEEDIMAVLGSCFNPGADCFSIQNSNRIGKSFLYNRKECVFIGLNFNLINHDIIYINDKPKKADAYIYSVTLFRKCLKDNFEINRDDYYYNDGDFIYIPLNEKNLLSENKEELLKKELEKIIEDVVLKNVS